MKVFSFVEGASPRRGGLGLVGVPFIAKSLADRGHQVVLNIGGRANPGSERFIQPTVTAALQHQNKEGTFGIVTYPSFGDWAFAPMIFTRVANSIRNADFITLHSLYSFPVFAGYLLARFYRKPYGLWPHGVLAPIQRSVSAGKKKIYDSIIARRILSDASVLFFSAAGERAEVCSLHLNPTTVVIPHGFDAQPYARLFDRGQFRAKYLQGHQGPLVLFLSRLNAKKGLDLLAKAFALVLKQMPGARLAIVGGSDPPAFEFELQNWIRQSGIQDRVILTGVLTDARKFHAFADADVFVLPSHAENFGFAVFEAMASRLPVVISDTLNYAEQIRRCDAGLVVPRDPQEFASAILKLLNDADLRQKMGENGLRLAKMYSWDKCGERVECAIQCVLQGKPFPPDLLPEK